MLSFVHSGIAIYGRYRRIELLEPTTHTSFDPEPQMALKSAFVPDGAGDHVEPFQRSMVPFSATTQALFVELAYTRNK